MQRKVASGERKMKPEEKAAPVAGKAGFRTGSLINTSYPDWNMPGSSMPCRAYGYPINLRRWLDAYNPDCIYAQATTREAGNFFLQSRAGVYKKPMIYHVMDDRPSTISQKGPFKTTGTKDR